MSVAPTLSRHRKTMPKQAVRIWLHALISTEDVSTRVSLKLAMVKNRSSSVTGQTS